MKVTYVTDQMRAVLANHVLELVAQTDQLTAYYLKRPDERMGSTLLVFTREGIAIMGDRVPKSNGTVSIFGVDLQWFASELSEDYLCKKFLRTTWSCDRAIEELRDPEGALRAGETEITLARFDELAEELEFGSGEEWLHEQLGDLAIDCSDGVPGSNCYNPNEAGWLCAIQQRFAELYVELQADESEAPDGR